MNFPVPIDFYRLAGPSERPSDGRTRGEAADDDSSDRIRRLRCRILVVDDDEPFLDAFADRLRDVYEAFVATACSATAAVKVLSEMEAFDLVLMDVDMPLEDGIAACQKMRNAGVFGRIVLMSSDAENAERACKIGAEFFEKSDGSALEAILAACKGGR